MTLEPPYTDDERAHARDVYEFYRKRVATYKTDEKWEKVPDENVPFALGSAGETSQTCGVFALVFDSFEDATSYFGEAATYFAESARERMNNDIRADIEMGTLIETPLAHTKAIYAALLSGDQELVRSAAEETLELNPQLQVPWGDSYDTVEFDANKYAYAMALAAVCLDHEEKAAEYLDDLSVTDEDHEGLRDLYAGVSAALQGILSQDIERLREGLDGVIARHQRIVDEGDESRPVSELVLSIEATALTVLARRRELSSDIESSYLPTEFVEWLMK